MPTCRPDNSACDAVNGCEFENLDKDDETSLTYYGHGNFELRPVT